MRSFDSEGSFAEFLRNYVSPAKPIDKHEFLFGRDEQLDRIRKALYAPGRHVFIHGFRGVGKSSLAQTAAHEYQSADADPVAVICGPEDTFESVVKAIVKKSVRAAGPSSSRISGVKLYGKYFDIEAGLSVSIADKSVPDSANRMSLQDAVDMLASISEFHSSSPIVVIDEFDNLSVAERQKFAGLLKGMGDQSTHTKLILSGIAETFDELLEGHGSVSRQLEAIYLDRLPWNFRWNIAEKVFGAIDVEIERSHLVRIAAISDGFPHYVHLIVEKLAWVIYEARASSVDKDLFNEALSRAVESISPHLSKSYRIATRNGGPDTHYLIWSVADAYDMDRKVDNIYRSYARICEDIGSSAMERSKISTRLAALKKSNGDGTGILASDRNSWYTFKEKMVRGYVRMVAESNGIELRGEEYDAPEVITARAKRDDSQRSRFRSKAPGNPYKR